MKSYEVNVFDPSQSAGRIIWALSWPSIVEQLLQVAVNYVDSAMVGVLGADQTAAISVCTSTIWLINGIMNAVAIGFSVLFARLVGARDRKRAEQVLRASVATFALAGLAILAGTVLIAHPLPIWLGSDPSIWKSGGDYMFYIGLGYFSTQMMIGLSALLRAAGDTRTPLLAAIFNNCLNIVLNMFFIFPSVSFFGLALPGLGMKVAGAAIATGIAATATSLVLLGTLARKDRKWHLVWNGSWKLDRNIERQGFLLALPVAMERVTVSSGQIVLTSMVSGLGVEALAAHYVANTAEQICFLPPQAFGTAATTVVAQSLGAGDKKLAKSYARICYAWGMGFMVVLATLMYVFAPELCSVFSPDPVVVALGAKVLRIEVFAEPGLVTSLLVSGIYRGAGNPKVPFFYTLFGMWIVRLPLAAILLRVTDWGLVCCWIAMASDLTSRGVISFVCYRKGNWLTAYDTPQSKH